MRKTRVLWEKTPEARIHTREEERKRAPSRASEIRNKKRKSSHQQQQKIIDILVLVLSIYIILVPTPSTDYDMYSARNTLLIITTQHTHTHTHIQTRRTSIIYLTSPLLSVAPSLPHSCGWMLGCSLFLPLPSLLELNQFGGLFRPRIFVAFHIPARHNHGTRWPRCPPPTPSRSPY
jgi:hypothetical protein